MTQPTGMSIPPHMKDSHYLITKKNHPWTGNVGKPLRFEAMSGGWYLILELDNGQSTCVSGMEDLQEVKR